MTAPDREDGITGDASKMPRSLEAQVIEALDDPSQDAVQELCDRYPEHASPILEFVRRARADRTEFGSQAASLAAPDRVGPYRIRDVLGEGGMGTVYLAHQEYPVERMVALKLIKLGMDTKQVLARFEAERRALAMMEHDCIAKVHDAGATDDGRPFFVMEHIKGVPINSYCLDNKLDVGDRIRLFQQVCRGVHHAHQKGVLHRDLKPSNVLVTDQGRHPVPKIIDFGLARATERDHLEATCFTEHGQIVGTPEYMSPEQASFGDQDIDTRSDIYSLGVLLYELLTGELPFPDLRAKGPLEMQRVIREDLPRKPSSRIGTQEMGRAATRHGRELRGDLDWITMKALEKERERRYSTAEALADDLARHLANQPVLAGPPSTLYRLGKLLRRRRGPAIAAVLLLASLAIGALLWLHESRRVQLLTDHHVLRGLEFQVDKLWPAIPDNVSAMDEWIRAAEQLIERLPSYRRWRTDDVTLATILNALIAGVQQLSEPKGGALSRIEKRRDDARDLAMRTIAGAAAREAWRDAAARIARADGIVASELYRTMPKLSPQMGLLPLRMDPKSKLWEFAHLLSGRVPTIAADGNYELNRRTCVVLVLVPPTRFFMGCQKTSRELPNYDVEAVPDESDENGRPVELELDAFFVSKYEMTQGQWHRITGNNPSAHSPNRNSSIHPVEMVTWDSCVEALSKVGLLLPTEAQWECAARGNRTTVWWTGDDVATLQGAANVLDSSVRRHLQGKPYETAIDDGYRYHAPVNTLRPNPFGLHHVHGNVQEWCRDWARDYSTDARKGDGYREFPPRRRSRCLRGGSYDERAYQGRSANRRWLIRSWHENTAGCRPMRPVTE